MFKKLLAVFLLIFVSLIFAITFLSYFGLETDRFNKLIKKKVLEVNEDVNLEFESTKTHLSIRDLKLVIKLKDSAMDTISSICELRSRMLLLSTETR